MSAEVYQELTEVIIAQNNELAVCMSELWTLSANAIDPFYTESETPVAAAMENLTIRHSSDTVRGPDTPIPTGGVENGNAPQSDWNNQPSIYVNDLLPGTPTSDILAVYAPFSQHHEDEASSAAPSEGPFHIDSSEINHANLQTDNSGRSGNSGNSGVFGVTPFGNTALATHRVANGSAPIHDLQAGRNTSDSTLKEEELPTRLSNYLPQEDITTREPWHNTWMAAPFGYASNAMNRQDTPLPTGNVVECESAEAQDWQKWIFLRKDSAQRNDLWAYVNPNVALETVLKLEEEKPAKKEAGAFYGRERQDGMVYDLEHLDEHEYGSTQPGTLATRRN
ncbi:hypothetical protein EJ07DRAFT_156040 [Lizonia empirigonia]|nr:hypothetical protein EJ07DRAFT_156040 [Lizonia empirigonia]